MPHDQPPQAWNKNRGRRERPHSSHPAHSSHPVHPAHPSPRGRTSAPYPQRQGPRGGYPERHHPPQPDVHDLMQPGHTGSEAEYLKSLIDSRARVTVVMEDGERLQGHLRYYDRDCFSIGLSATGPRIFLRKDSVSYISEDEDS